VKHTRIRIAVLGLVALAACASERTRHLPAQGALGPYSAAVISGELCFVSGKVGAVRDDFDAEANSAIDAVAAELAREHLELADVASCTVYLTDMALYPALNKIYASRFPEPYPARACVAVSALPASAHVEIQVIARRR
jgi:2-iminobutanoate/2-iminopropanoate deaminase